MKALTKLNRQFTIRLLACAAAFAAMAPTRAALVARLTFDDPAHLTADSSGNGNDAIVAGRPSADTGRMGGAVNFAGNAYFLWQGSTNPVVQMLNASFTVCVWIKTTQTFASDNSRAWEGAGIVWADYPGTPPIGDTIPLALTGSKACGFAAAPYLHSTSSINGGQWVHLAFVRYANPTNCYERLYVNGRPEATASGRDAPVSDAGRVAVGANPLDGRYFIGSMDDLQFYNSALSDSEVADTYNNAAATLSIRVSQVQVELCWGTLTNAWYQLQYCSTLTTNQWVPLTGGWSPGTGARYCTNGALQVGLSQRFYRVAVTNSPPYR